MTLEDNMETLEAINKRKSIRAYKDEQITKEELDSVNWLPADIDLIQRLKGKL